MRSSLLVTLCLSTLAPAALAQSPLSPPTLTPGALASFSGARFGGALDLDGDRALVSGSVTSFGTSLSGSAWVYAWNGAGWDIEQHLDAPGFSSYQDYGTSVALSGDVAIVACRYMDTASGNNSGGAVVYERVGGVWTVVDELLPPPDSDQARYGYGVDVEGDLAILSSDDTVRPYLAFERSPSGSWDLVQELDATANNPFPNGGGISTTGPRIVDGRAYLPDPNYPNGANFSGEIEVWRHEAGTWVFESAIRTAAPTEGTYLGLGFDVSGDVLVSGSPFVVNASGSNGRVHTFERQGGTWVEVDQLLPGVVTGQLWGRQVALAGDRLAVGNPLVPGDGSVAPVVELYARDGDGWRFERQLVDPAGAPAPYVPGDNAYGSGYGGTLAIEGDRGLIGAPFDDVRFENAGEVYGVDMGLLGIDTAEISLSAGGVQTLDLQAGASAAGDLHLVLGSFAGTSPGVSLGAVTLPLEIDAYFSFLLANPGAAPVLGGLGQLGPDGSASAQVQIPPGAAPSAAGAVVHHAFVTIDPVTLTVESASEAEALTLRP